MTKKHYSYSSADIIQRSEILIKSASNRYQITNRVANHAKRYRYDDFENFDSPAMKPVIRAIIEMTDELAESDSDNKFTETATRARSSNFYLNPKIPPSSKDSKRPLLPGKSKSNPSSIHPTTSSAISSTARSATLESTRSEIACQINFEVDANPQLLELKQESDSKAWNQIIEWISESICHLNFAAAEVSVERLKLKYQNKSPREIAHILIVHKSIQAAGVDLVRGIPKAEDILRGIAKYDLPEITKLAAEMVYQIAAIYGFNLQDPARRTEALTAFGATFLGEQAIAAGIGWLKRGWFPSLIISAGAKALMIYAVGNAACLFYEAKLKSRFNSQLNPLSSPLALNEIRKASQQYLSSATSESAIIEIVSSEINIIDNKFTQPATKAINSNSEPKLKITVPSAINSITSSPASSKLPTPPLLVEPTTPSVIFSTTISETLESKAFRIALQINVEVDANPQLLQLKQESNPYAWNQIIEWTSQSICNINFTAPEISVERLKLSYQGKPPREIARVLIVQKSIQAAGVDLVRGIPKAEDILRGIAKYDLPEITKLLAEIVYQIAAIYEFDLQDPARKTEVLIAFGATFLGEQAVVAGIDWLKCSSFPSFINSAAAKALIIYAVGNAACLFYEAKLKSRFNSQSNPLTSSLVLNGIRKASQQYISSATSESAIVKIVSTEIATALTIDYTVLGNLLKARKWKQADLETCNIVLKIANRDAEGSLKKIASEDLRTINQLWSINSSSYFGFGAQKQIYLSVSQDVGVFGEKIGWRGTKGLFGGILGWKSYPWLTFNSDKAPKGHLPAAFCLTLPWWYHKGEVTRDFAESILQRNDW